MRSYFTPLTLLFGSFLTTIAQADTQLLVTTSANQGAQVQLTYPTAVRLEQAVQDGLVQLPKYNKTTSNETVPIYWLGAALLDIQNTAVLENKRKEALSELAKVGEASNDSIYIAKLAKLAQFLRQIKLGKRVMQPLDLDLIRITDSYNPLLDGRFELVLPPRPTTIVVAGAVARTGSYKWKLNTSSKDYLAKAQPLENSDGDFVWIIQPDGNAIKQPIAYWNAQAQDIAPGAVIYLEFSDLLEDYSTLNANIIELLRNRAL
ncbi:capsule biosynthesis GfcC family protein [Shewanella baltica]|uniref:capsule biosynthesis GfcC family protein n=1 Tax=Shewanella baltica TaxID=62322 RepID=UPI0039B097C1